MPGDNGAEKTIRPASFSRQTLVTLFAQGINFAAGILVTPLVFKFSGARTYGDYVLIMAAAGLLYGVSSFGIGFSAKRYLPSAETRKDRAELFYPQFWANQSVIVFMSGLLFVLWLGSSTWTEIAGFQVLFVCAYLLLQSLQSQCGDYLRATHQIVSFNFVMTAQPLLYASIVLSSFWLSGQIGLHTLLLAQLASILAMALFGAAKIISDAGVMLRLPSPSSLRTDILLGGPLILSYIVDTVLAFSDRYVIGFMLTVEDVAYYAAAYTLASVPLFIAKAIAVVLIPRLSLLVDTGRHEEAMRTVEQTIRIFLLFALPFFAGVTVVGSNLLALYTTPAAAEEARYALPLIAAGTIFYGVFLIYTAVSAVLLKTRQILKANFVAALLNVGLNIVLLRFIPDIAVAAATTLFSYLLILHSLTSGLGKEWLAVLKVDHVLRIAAASAGMAVIVFAVKTMWTSLPGEPLHTLVLVLIGLAAYTALAFLTRAVSTREIADLKRAIANRAA